MNFKDAKLFVRTLNLKKYSDWLLYTSQDHFPENLPSNPQLVYKNNGWTSWGDWLGTGSIHPSK